MTEEVKHILTELHTCFKENKKAAKWSDDDDVKMKTKVNNIIKALGEPTSYEVKSNFDFYSLIMTYNLSKIKSSNIISEATFTLYLNGYKQVAFSFYTIKDKEECGLGIKVYEPYVKIHKEYKNWLFAIVAHSISSSHVNKYDQYITNSDDFITRTGPTIGEFFGMAPENLLFRFRSADELNKPITSLEHLTENYEKGPGPFKRITPTELGFQFVVFNIEANDFLTNSKEYLENLCFRLNTVE